MSTTTIEKRASISSIGVEMANYYLKNNDFEILESNWKCESGKVDLIVREDDDLVFIEVKTRGMSSDSGLPEESVTSKKRSKYERIAINYLSKMPQPSGRVRFDVIAVKLTGEKQCLLRHHRDAFSQAE